MRSPHTLPGMRCWQAPTHPRRTVACSALPCVGRFDLHGLFHSGLVLMACALRRVFQRVAKKVIREYERTERSCFPCGALLRSLSKPVDVRASGVTLTTPLDELLHGPKAT